MTTELFRPISNTPPTTFMGKIKFYGRMVFDLQAWTVYRDLRRHLTKLRGNVLDVGCGQSPYQFLLDSQATRYVGIDISDADKFDYENSEIVPFDGEHIPFPDGYFGAVICTEVLEHVSHFQELVDEIYRVMKDGGEAIITVPWSARFHYVPYDFFRYTPSSLRDMFATFREVIISPRGTDISVIGSKLVVLWFRNLLPSDRRKLYWFRCGFSPVRSSPSFSQLPMFVPLPVQDRLMIRSVIQSRRLNELYSKVPLMGISRRWRSEDIRSVRDESGYNQGWTGGLSTKIREERRSELMISKMTPDPSRCVLEIGCGRGEVARYIAAKTGIRVLGVDRSERFVQEANAHAGDRNVRFEVLHFTRPNSILGRRFDYVVGNGILHHPFITI